MSTLAIDTRKLLKALKATGKSANFTAEEIADAVDVAQVASELLTKPVFEARMAEFAARPEALRADIKAEVKGSQLQNLMWLSGIMLASNGVVIALLGRLAHVF